MLIIDEQTTFVGGVCIYDEITHWRDTMVELNGSITQQFLHIYYYKPTMLHLKMMVIDEAWAAIGSCNLDGLSMRQNQEVMLVSVDETFVRALHTHYDEDKAASAYFSLADWKKRPLSQKITGRIAVCVRHFI